MVTSGIRIGTPAVTTRGFKEEQVKVIVDLIDRALLCREDEAELLKITKEVTALCTAFPVYSKQTDIFISPAVKTETEAGL